MTIRDRIASLFPSFRRRDMVLSFGSYTGFDGITCLPFGETIFQNIVEMLTDLLNDVEWVNLSRVGNMAFAEFVRFVNEEGRVALWRVYKRGFAVVGRTESGTLRLLDREEYIEIVDGGATVIRAKDTAVSVYVMKSECYRAEGKSDWQLCRPYIELLDNTFNATNTAVSKLGALVVASPENTSASPTPAVLKKEDKQAMEDEIGKEYGLLNKQKQVMLLPRQMKFETISLTNIDNKLTERVRMAVEVICDRIKVPANQVAVVDANSSKALSNGGEIHEGDLLKYKSFERLLNATIMRMASSLGLRVTYSMYNKTNSKQ